ncbi:MAG TPA: hypothetical protein VGG27_01675 [Magnetospirillaceae bacterium]|jgi:hypothetical protein
MLEKGEWEPERLQPIKTLLPLCLIRVECIHCRHTADIPSTRLERLDPALLVAELQDKLRCNHCDERGRVRFYVRRKPR